MSVEGLAIALILLLLVSVWTVNPLIRHESTQSTSDLLREKQRERLLVYYERVLTNIRDLDEDHATGKMHAHDYASEREEQVIRGIQVLKALDRLDLSEVTSNDTFATEINQAENTDAALIDSAIDNAIEAAIDDFRAKTSA